MKLLSICQSSAEEFPTVILRLMSIKHSINYFGNKERIYEISENHKDYKGNNYEC